MEQRILLELMIEGHILGNGRCICLVLESKNNFEAQANSGDGMTTNPRASLAELEKKEVSKGPSKKKINITSRLMSEISLYLSSAASPALFHVS